MKCSNCQADLSTDANYCGQCCARVTEHCRRCNRVIVATSPFCEGCGFEHSSDLTDDSFIEHGVRYALKIGKSQLTCFTQLFLNVIAPLFRVQKAGWAAEDVLSCWRFADLQYPHSITLCNA